MLNGFLTWYFIIHIYFKITVSAGLGDALGVDWASLVADVRRREQTAPTGGARDRWRPERVLTRLGLSLDMAGEETIQNILHKNAETLNTDKETPVAQLQENSEQSITEQNGKIEHRHVLDPDTPMDINSLHPVAAIQVLFKVNLSIYILFRGMHCIYAVAVLILLKFE